MPSIISAPTRGLGHMMPSGHMAFLNKRDVDLLLMHTLFRRERELRLLPVLRNSESRSRTPRLVLSPVPRILEVYRNIAQTFGVSNELAIASVSLYVLGFAFGPSCWGLLSEVWGRRWSMLPAMVILGCFIIGTAKSKNIQSILITRFFSALGDMWSLQVRGTARCFYTLAVLGGITLGPVVGSAILINSHLTIFVFGITAISIFCLPEVYSPYMLKTKAGMLRKQTGDLRYHHHHEKVKADLKSIFAKHLARPGRMIIFEPIVTFVAFYASFVFAILYLTPEVFPIALPFVSLFLGVLVTALINIANEPRYRRLSAAADGRPVPEGRLLPMTVGGVIMCGLFWFGWTTLNAFWLSPMMAIVFIGAGFTVIFQQCLNYLVDTYRIYAASAVSANTLLRSFLAAIFPLFARPMFNILGVGPGMSIIGAVAAFLLPLPLVLMRYGEWLCTKSKFWHVDNTAR
ncbi:hypothetical protein OIDMADRAFT_45370 [Oidiodendron maius Zn]|uniref:Major facilitator superfamily (MFS) profile domain-containing protein n=1 Tax=Oidiodendron maius (strain Zn) TaxID=913774 RepID=A0A0C3GU99_OIDMZ|nr:hypothetical protein OIDMADRAFT_45370 [Oidiodendron maius Zn]